MADRLCANPKISDIKRKAYAGISGPMLDTHEVMAPAKKRKPSRIAVQFMGDLFHESIFLVDTYPVFNIMALTGIHTFLLLTKRPTRMKNFINKHWCKLNGDLPENIWPGGSICNQKEADKKIPILLNIPGTKWLSVEPMLSEIRIPEEQLREISWVVVGCESGPGRRQASDDWFRSLRDQCADTDTPYFLKQMEIGGKVVSMPELDGKIHAEMPK